MSDRRKYFVILVLLILVTGFSGILSDVAASSLPASWAPYLWVAWPLFAVFTVLSIVLAILQVRTEKGSPIEADSRTPMLSGSGQGPARTGQHTQPAQPTVEEPTSEPMSGGQSVDFVIITALAEERDAILRKLPGHRRVNPSRHDIRTYYSSHITTSLPDGGSGVHRVVVMPLLGMGRVQASIATADAIRRWNPRFVILVGIAGGIASKGVSLGDVLISTQIVDYELQKETEHGAQIRWEVYRADPRLLNAAQNLSNRQWYSLIEVERPTSDGDAQEHFGPIASGDKVIAFREALQKYQAKWPMLIGVEMEAGGSATAAFQADAAPGFFMIRGVSDFADESKNAEAVVQWRPYACDVAASYTVALISSGFVLPHEDASNLYEAPSVGESLSGFVINDVDTNTLTDLLVRSGRANYTARKALLIEIGVDPDSLGFLEHTSSRDFAIELIRFLNKTGNTTAMLSLCNAIKPQLKGQLGQALYSICDKVGAANG